MENKENYNSIIGTDEKKIVLDVDVTAEQTPVHSTERHTHHSGHHGHHSHHHSSHHSGHHHRRHSRNNNKKKKLNISNKAGWTISISFLALCVVVAVSVVMLNPKQPNFSEQQSSEQMSGNLIVEVNNQEGLLVKNAVNKFLLADILNPANANIVPSSFSNDDGRLDAQVPVSLELSVKEGEAISYKIEFADNDSFMNAETAYVEAASGNYEFKHLYANATYYYRVTAYTSKGTETVVGNFQTADTPRILSVDGLSNVRDIGNWRTDGGKRIKQGLLIRGTEMDAAVEKGYHLTNEGLVDMIEIFGIKTDVDLRAQTPTSKDALGARVEHKYYNMVMYDAIFTNEGKEKVRTVFADLANPDNYPIYLHCTYGRDRTGTICYLLEALLGVSRGDCLRDYSLSNVNIVNIQAVENGLKAYEGDTLKEQVESYLLSCGVSEYQINSIRKIFLDD